MRPGRQEYSFYTHSNKIESSCTNLHYMPVFFTRCDVDILHNVGEEKKPYHFMTPKGGENGLLGNKDLQTVDM